MRAPAGTSSHRHPGRVAVVASFRRAAYVELGPSTLAVTTGDVPAGPLHLRLRALPRLEVGEPVVATAERLTIGAVTLPRAGLERWQPPVVRASALAARARPAMDDVLPEAGRSALVDDPAAAAVPAALARGDLPAAVAALPRAGERASRRPVTTPSPGSCSCWPSPVTTGPSSSEPRRRRGRTPSPEPSCAGPPGGKRSHRSTSSWRRWPTVTAPRSNATDQRSRRSARPRVPTSSSAWGWGSVRSPTEWRRRREVRTAAAPARWPSSACRRGCASGAGGRCGSGGRRPARARSARRPRPARTRLR